MGDERASLNPSSHLEGTAQEFSHPVIFAPLRREQKRPYLLDIRKAIGTQAALFRFDIQNLSYEFRVQTDLDRGVQAALQGEGELFYKRSVNQLSLYWGQLCPDEFVLVPPGGHAEIVRLMNVVLRWQAHSESLALHDISIGVSCLTKRDSNAWRAGAADACPGSGHHIRLSGMVIGQPRKPVQDTARSSFPEISSYELLVHQFTNISNGLYHRL